MHNFQNGSNVHKNMQQKVNIVQKMLNELVIIMKVALPLNLNLTTQNFISTEFYHIGIKALIADKSTIYQQLDMAKLSFTIFASCK